MANFPFKLSFPSFLSPSRSQSKPSHHNPAPYSLLPKMQAQEIQLQPSQVQTAPQNDQKEPINQPTPSSLMDTSNLLPPSRQTCTVPKPISTTKSSSNKLKLIPLIFLIYFEVAGGPYGAEESIQAVGPLYAIIGFFIFPFLWGVPESLVTAELATALPGNGGFVVWADRAFGPFFGSLMGTWKYLSCVINIGAYPPMCADYISRAYPPAAAGPGRSVAISITVVLLCLLNYTGLSVVGWGAVVLAVVTLAPFVLITVMAMRMLQPKRWMVQVEKKDWRQFLNILFWNLNYWDSASTMAGEVEQPEKTFPKGLAIAVVICSVSYFLPVMAGTGAIDSPPEAWVNGYFADVADMIGGNWLKYWIQAGAVLSSIGLYEAQLSSGAFQLLGMADLGLLPSVFAVRAPKFDTPWVGILLSCIITLTISFLPFEDIVATANILYSLGMLLEFATFLWLRMKYPDLKRPYRVPLGIPGLIVMCLFPSVLLGYVIAVASRRVFLLSAVLTVFGIAVHYSMRYCRSRGLLKFTDNEGLEDEQTEKERIVLGDEEEINGVV
ncbi:Cationic amino acid transporter [Rhynchospora pubera]|uniref:Polyamine transporter PUT1 n=1 Tax=Rhynchospora pubera TaxID=906938 RepID=A0AAV8HQ85_9POAL|nr:Cationic amino acid transporter [Rhynchospora pubera]